MADTIVFIHGNFVTQRTWEPWVARYSARGYKVVSIAYPGRDKPVKALKANPKDPFLRTLDIKTTIDHHVQSIRALGEKPIIIGHSFEIGRASCRERVCQYDLDIVPESRRLARGGLSSAAQVDFKRSHAPLLFIAGEKDRLMPASLNRTNYERYKSKSSSLVEFKEFAGRGHYSIIGGEGWEEVADCALAWAQRITNTVDVVPPGTRVTDKASLA